MSLSYDGTDYHGWQEQPGATSVQGEVRRCLSTLLRRETGVTGAGRTDAGVHAGLMVAHFDCVDNASGQGGASGQGIDCGELCYRLNKVLPPDIAVGGIRPVPAWAHARYSALARTYHYYVALHKIPFRRRYSWRVYGAVDFGLMNLAAEALLGRHDFASFRKGASEDPARGTLCTVEEARWEEAEPGLWCFTVTADRFLRNMVRAMVGTLMEVGRGKAEAESVARAMERRERCAAGESVPACGLFLAGIRYPEGL